MEDRDLDLSDEPFWVASICERPVRLFRSDREGPELPWAHGHDLFEALAWPPAEVRDRVLNDMVAGCPHRYRALGTTQLFSFYTTQEVLHAAVDAKAAPASCVANFGDAFADFLVKQCAVDAVPEDEACAYIDQAARNTFDRDVRGDAVTRKSRH